MHYLLSGNPQLQSASRSPDFYDIGDAIHGPLVLLMVASKSVRISDTRLVRVDGSVGSGTELEVGEVIELDFNLILRVPLALCLDLLSL